METNNNRKERCEECGDWYQPSLHKGGVQGTCLKPECQRERHGKNCQRWREKNPGKGEMGQSKKEKKKERAAKTGYWANYRKEHPEYREREASRMRAKRKAASREAALKTVANRDSVRQIFLAKLESIPVSSPESVANRDSVRTGFPMDQRVDQVISCLKWRESVAN